MICSCCSVAQSCPTLCDPMDCSTPGLPVPHHLPKFAQVHVHCIGYDIQPSHPLMLPSPSAVNLSQHYGVFQWVICSHQVTKIPGASASVLPMSIQGWFPLQLMVWTPCCPRQFQESSPAPQFEGTNSLAFCCLYGPALTIVYDHWEDHSADYTDLHQQNNVSAFQHTV